MPHSPVESYRRSGRDVGENLIAETSACPLTTRVPLTLEGWCRDKGRLPLPIIIPNHPLDKIFGDIPAQLTDFTHASVRHYLEPHFFIDKWVRRLLIDWSNHFAILQLYTGRKDPLSLTAF